MNQARKMRIDARNARKASALSRRQDRKDANAAARQNRKDQRLQSGKDLGTTLSNMANTALTTVSAFVPGLSEGKNAEDYINQPPPSIDTNAPAAPTKSALTSWISSNIYMFGGIVVGVIMLIVVIVVFFKKKKPRYGKR